MADIRTDFSDLITLRDVLRYAVSAFRGAEVFHGHGATNALDEAAFLILETLHLPVDDFNTFADARLTQREKALLAERITQRIATRLPAAYITGRTYLHGFAFRADQRAIIPRSYLAELLFSPLFNGLGEEEALVDDPEEITSVLDLCTGGGSLAILAAHAFPNAMVDAVDLSADALALAAENIADYGLEGRITLYLGDLFAPLKGKTYDLIITNPPYVGAEAMAMLPPEFKHEPVMALAGGGEEGIEIPRRILKRAKAHLEPGGGILCEVGLAREALEAAEQTIPFLWLDTQESEAEVFWLTRDDLI